MASVAFAEAGSPGVLANRIGWINFGAGFILTPNTNTSILITNDIPGNYEIRFNISLTQTGEPDIGITAVTPPTIPGQSAFGTTGYVGINAPVNLYMNANAPSSFVTLTITLDDITVINKSTGLQISNYSIVAADNEVSNATELWTVVTNGGPWIKLETLPAVAEPTSAYRIIGDGSSTISANSVNVPGEGDENTPAIVVLSESPTQVQAIFTTEVGREGVTFGVIINDNFKPIYNCCNIIKS
ncbi:MAG: hypothetical protein Q4F66_01275 [Clostridium sp.]|nr:hypothetical protein [Clostridium sp.]